MDTIIFIIIAVIISYAHCVVLVVKPEVVRLGKDDLEVTCRPSMAKNVISVSYIRIYSSIKGSFGDSSSKIARVLYRNESSVLQKVKWTDSRYIITGNVSNPRTAYLRVKVKADKVKCEDSVWYRCEMKAKYKDIESQEYIADRYVNITDEEKVISKIEVKSPESLTVTPYGTYKLGTVLTLSCNATTGNEDERIKWCIQQGSDQSLTEVRSNITTVIKMMSACRYRHSSSIAFVLQQPSSYTWFQCTLGTCGGVSTGSFYAAYTTGHGQNSARLRIISERRVLISGVFLAILGVTSLIIAVVLVLRSKRHAGAVIANEEEKTQQSQPYNVETSTYADIESRTQYDIVYFLNDTNEESPYTALQTPSSASCSKEDVNKTNSSEELNKGDKSGEDISEKT